MFEPDPAEGDENENTKESKDEGEGFGQVRETKGCTHPCGIAQTACGEVIQQRSESEQKTSLQKRVRAYFAHAQLTLARDHQQGEADVAQSILID